MGKSDIPYTWITIQANLSIALADQGDTAAASDALEKCVQAFPTDLYALRRAVPVYQNNLFRYDRAHEVAENWFKLDPSPETRLTLEQEDLVTNRFDDCEKQAAAIGDADFPTDAGPMTLIRDTAKLACQWGAGQKADAHQSAKALLLKSTQLQKTGLKFAGTRHYLASAPAFEPGRASWIALFDSLEKGDSSAMDTALNQLQPFIER
jgi:hypothetical protein